METQYRDAGSLRVLSISAPRTPRLGAALFWWVPLGMIVSLAGVTLAVVDFTIARRRSLDARISIAAFFVGLAALGLDIFIAILGTELIPFTAFR